MKMIIDGKKVDSVSKETFDVIAPATGIVVDNVPKATAEDIKEYCSKNLAKIKQPKYVEIVEEIPRNSVGKVLMSKVHELYGNVD